MNTAFIKKIRVPDMSFSYWASQAPPTNDDHRLADKSSNNIISLKKGKQYVDKKPSFDLGEKTDNPIDS